MAKANIKISGRNGVLALVVVCGFAVYRFLSFASTNDVDLKQKILVELQSERGNEVGKLLQAGRDSNNYSQLAENVATLVNQEPTIYTLAVSKPLLSLSSSAKTVVKVDYSLPGAGKRTTKYFRARDSIVGGWTIQGETTIVAYYLNFL